MTVTERPTSSDHVGAVKAVLVAGLPSSVPVLSHSQVQNYSGNLPSQYVELSVSRRYRPNSRLDAMDPSESRRIVVWFVGSTEDNALLVGDKCRAALEHAPLTIAGRQSTRVQYETSDIVQPDGAMFSGSTDFTYAL